MEQERKPREDRQRSRPAEGERRRGAEAPPRKSAKRQISQREAEKKRPPRKKLQAQPQRRREKEIPDDLSVKRRAYGNSRPKKKSAVATFMENAQKAGEQRAAKKLAKMEMGQKPKTTLKENLAPTVIYTDPTPFNRRRVITQLLSVIAVVLAMVIGLSVFFKVKVVAVTGASVYDPWTIKEASGIQVGDNLLTFSRARAGALMKANLPYVEEVRFGVKLPDTVNIIVKEANVVYAIQDSNGQWWLMSSTGRIVEQTTSGKAGNYTQILGVSLANPHQDADAVANEPTAAPVETAPPAEGETLPTTTPAEATVAAQVGVTAAARLATAQEILRALEDNDIVGSAASIDVTRAEDIIIWYGTRYQINLGDSSNIAYKIACMKDVIAQMSDYQSGVLDISFTIWPDKVGYTPFA